MQVLDKIQATVKMYPSAQCRDIQFYDAVLQETTHKNSESISNYFPDVKV